MYAISITWPELQRLQVNISKRLLFDVDDMKTGGGFADMCVRLYFI